MFHLQPCHLLLIVCPLGFVLPAFPTGNGKAALYLHKFGYLGPDPTKDKSIPEETLTEAIREFQAFIGINITGSRWSSKNVTYRVTKYTQRFPKHVVDDVMRRAFLQWGHVIPQKFIYKKTGNVDIEISFETGNHGNDESAFEGRGGSLAHAFYPIFGGDIHFDDDEDWTLTDEGINLFQVATHEIGHSLGLAHSDVDCAVMAPTYKFDYDFALDIDDIEGIQSIYGHRQYPMHHHHHHFDVVHDSNQDYEDFNPHQDNDICSHDPSFDTIFDTTDDETYILKGNKSWLLTKQSRIAPGFPKLINDVWPGLPDNIDAAFTHANKRTYFFKGTKYWRFKGKTLEDGYPKLISDTFPGLPNNIDAAMVWGGDGKVYFFKGEDYWCYDPKKRPPIDESYPKPISKWYGVPPNLDGAFTNSDGLTYFFKNGLYYRFNNDHFCVDTAYPPYPRPTRFWWYHC